VQLLNIAFLGHEEVVLEEMYSSDSPQMSKTKAHIQAGIRKTPLTLPRKIQSLSCVWAFVNAHEVSAFYTAKT
jgi:hypothetical protein